MQKIAKVWALLNPSKIIIGLALEEQGWFNFREVFNPVLVDLEKGHRSPDRRLQRLRKLLYLSKH